jgi:hypothetical protein
MDVYHSGKIPIQITSSDKSRLDITGVFKEDIRATFWVLGIFPQYFIGNFGSYCPTSHKLGKILF